MERYTKLGISIQGVKDSEAERRVLADNCLDTSCIRSFKILNASNASVDELSDGNFAYLGDLNHLHWAVVPGLGPKTTLQHHCVLNGDRIAQDDLTVDDTSNKSVD